MEIKKRIVGNNARAVMKHMCLTAHKIKHLFETRTNTVSHVLCAPVRHGIKGYLYINLRGGGEKEKPALFALSHEDGVVAMTPKKSQTARHRYKADLHNFPYE